MTKRIIRPGPSEFEATCSRCGTTFAYGFDDVPSWTSMVSCPRCGREVCHSALPKLPDVSLSAAHVSALSKRHIDCTVCNDTGVRWCGDSEPCTCAAGTALRIKQDAACGRHDGPQLIPIADAIAKAGTPEGMTQQDLEMLNGILEDFVPRAIPIIGKSAECWCGSETTFAYWCAGHAPRCRSGAHFYGNCQCSGKNKEDK